MKSIGQIRRLLFWVLVTMHSLVMAQDKIIYFSDSATFQVIKPIQYGTTILVEGQSKSNYNGVELELRVNNKQPEKIPVQVSDNRWFALIGPFPIGAHLILSVQESKAISKEDVAVFQNQIIQVLNASIEYAFQKGLESVSFGNLVYAISDTTLSGKFLRYRTPAGTRIDSAVLGSILVNAKNSGAINHLVKFEWKSSTWEDLNPLLEKSSLAKNLKENPVSIFALDSMEYVAYLDSALSPHKLEQHEMLKNDLLAQYKDYRDGLAQFNRLKSKITEVAYTTAMNSTALSSTVADQQVSGLMKYVGTDIGLMVIPGMGKAPVFALFSPHLRRLDPEKDYKFKGKEGSWKYFFAPTFGIGLGQGLEGLQPVYYTGISLRQNTAIRYHLGLVYYGSSTRSRFDSYASLGVSLSLHYLPQFLQVLSSVQTNY